jgi:hypothetical protein
MVEFWWGVLLGWGKFPMPTSCKLLVKRVRAGKFVECKMEIIQREGKKRNK